MNILTSLQKLAGRVRQQRFSRLATGIVSALAVCSATSVLGQVNVTTLGGGPGSTDVGTTPGSSVITFSGGSSGAQGIKLDNPLGLAFDSAGNLYIAENAQGNVLRVTNPGNRNTSFTYMFATGLTQPVAVTVAPNGDVYVLTSPTGGGSIRRYTSDGTFVSAITTALVSPTSFLLTDTGNFIVTEIGGTVKQVTPVGVVTTLTAAFTSPTGIAQYSAGQVAIADAGDNSIRQLNLLDPTTITLLAGGNGAGFTNGSALSAQFNMPRHISYSPNGSLIIADQMNHRVRILTPDGRVETVYGVSTNNWPDNPFFATYPGWKDGTNAHANQPFGVVVGPGATNIYVTEIGHTLDLLRVASGFSLALPTGTNTTVTNIFADTTATNVVISLGFGNGEASSDYLASAGQYFQVPITLTLPTTKQIYSLGFAVAVTNVGGSPATAPTAVGFVSKLKYPVETDNGKIYLTIPNSSFLGFVTNIVVNPTTLEATTNLVPVYTNVLITNLAAKLMDVAWLEMPRAGVLYPKNQDLIAFSQPHFNIFEAHSAGRVVLGSFGFQIPAGAPIGSEYRVQVYNASGTEELNIGVDIVAAKNTNAVALGAGSANSLKRIMVGNPRTYVVGDIEGFRWYNAGEFGNGKLEMVDVQEAFIMTTFGLNRPTPVTSDFFNTVDSYDVGSGVNPYTGDIDTVTTGDGILTVDDIITTLRRTLDYTVRYVHRSPGGVFASNSVGVVPPDFGLSSFRAAELASVPATKTIIAVQAADVIQSGGTIQVPIRATVTGSERAKRMMLSVLVEPIGGAPDLSEAVGFTLGSTSYLGLPDPSFIARQGSTAVSLAWLGNSGFSEPPGLPAGQHTLINLSLKPKRPLVAGEYYRIKVAHYSPSPGYAFETTTRDGIVSPINMSSISTVGDGIPDSWRYRFFGRIFDLTTLPDADSDGDGVPNSQEYRAGTNPADGKSAFRVTESSKSESNSVTIRFHTVLGRQYVVESCASFGTGWTQVGTTVNGTDAEVTVTDNSPGANVKFYRIRMVDGAFQ